MSVDSIDLEVIRVYADTSVFGGVFDEEFSRPSKKFFDEVRNGRFLLVVSAVVHAELSGAPKQVQDFFASMIGSFELAEMTKEVFELRQGYLDAKIVTKKSIDDATHVASAAVARCDMIVSWNFKHIVHFEKIPKYNAVNIAKGYSQLNIFSPLGVIRYDDA